MKERENWGSKIGLILAMSGNAIGLGNFWRFPYQAAKNGGGAFMLPYVIALFVLGIPIILVEWMQGRYGGKYGHGTIGYMVYLQSREKIKPKRAAILGSICGMIVIGVTVLVNSYYNHIIGWTLGYGIFTAAGKTMDANVSTGDFFVNYVTSPGPVFIFWIISLGFLALAVTRGIQKGIEAWAKLMMPILYVFGFILIFKSVTIGAPVKPEWSALKGLDYLWSPRWSELSWQTALAASGQIFFTLSLGMGIIQNYASYIKEDDDIVLSSLTTVGLNEFAEVILGGTIVIPICYAFLGAEGLSQSIGLTFISLPNIFRAVNGGRAIGTLWFILLFCAGITSAIAMYNYIVAILEEDMGFTRKKASILVFALYIIVGLPVGLEQIITKTAGFAYFSEVDNWVGTYFLVIMGLIEIVVTGWLMKDSFLDEINRGAYWKLPSWVYNVVIKFITPISILLLLIGSTMDYIKQGYFKLVPDFVAKTPELVPWVNGARIIIIIVFTLGFIGTYRSIKKVYGEELESNSVIIKK
ncbi:sodium-dependent transporter [Clostridium ganghwense]|uniref:Transporter n=1 Tax=Clostridium ganghwense TaxID=312089 RepID=A0ABT4CN12_9CLOT|nr:sodium-dependent transporter [Clostridium ganghwense]MCY6370445.1 sodium-dependent transporter [Clostridium ganghwense]